MSTELELRAIGDGEDEAFLALHNRCFEPRWTRAMWDWRYRSLPRGEAAILGAYTPDGRLIGMYAGVRLLLQIQGESGWALSQGDVAVEAAFRGGNGRSKVVVRLGRRFLQGQGAGGTKLTYGFPIPPLRRLASRFLGGQVFTDVVFLVHRLGELPPGTGAIRVQPVERFGPEASRLWEGVRGELDAALVRDEAYLNWRYAAHPVAYALLEARDTRSNALRGLAVLREGGWNEAVASLVEWLVPAADRDAEHALVRHAVTYARERRKQYLVAWFSSAGPHFERFQVEHGFFARATPYQEEVTSWHPGADREWLLHHWYQTMGDIDFF